MRGINRGTFYLHYKDIYDLRDQIEEEMMADFSKGAVPPVGDRAGCFPGENHHGHFSMPEGQCGSLHGDIGDYGDKAFAYRLVNIGREKCLDAYSRFFASATPKQIEFFYAFVSAGCIGLLQMMAGRGMVTGAQEVAAMAEDIMMYGMGFFSKKARTGNQGSGLLGPAGVWYCACKME